MMHRLKALGMPRTLGTRSAVEFRGFIHYPG